MTKKSPYITLDRTLFGVESALMRMNFMQQERIARFESYAIARDDGGMQRAKLESWLTSARKEIIRVKKFSADSYEDLSVGRDHGAVPRTRLGRPILPPPNDGVSRPVTDDMPPEGPPRMAPETVDLSGDDPLHPGMVFLVPPGTGRPYTIKAIRADGVHVRGTGLRALLRFTPEQARAGLLR